MTVETPDKIDAGTVLMVREYRKCAPDWETSTIEEKLEGFRYWCANYVYISPPNKGRMKLELRGSQLETVRAWLTHRANIALKARQVGFSTIVSLFAFWLAFFYPDQRIIMISKGQREARDLLGNHAKYAFQFLPEWMLDLGPTINWTQDQATFSNGSQIRSVPSRDPARGSSATLVVVDEIAFLENSEEAYAAIEPVFDVGGRIVVLSTANGEGNLFHKLWVGSQTKAGFGSQYNGIFFSWRANEDRDENWFKAKCAELPEWQRAQEYPDNPEEAFLKSGRPVFDLEKLRSIDEWIREHVGEPQAGRVDETPEGGYHFVADGGQLHVWKEPNPQHAYVIGADIAQGLEHGDYSSAHVIDANTGEVVAHWWGHGDPDLFGEYVLYNLGHWYNYALLGPESNNHGLTTITALRRAGYRNIWRQRHLGTRKQQKSDSLGWNTNRATKPLAIDELGKAIREDALTIYDPYTVAELRTFVRQGDGKMHGSPHDDRVMSLAIANQMLKYVWLDEYKNARPKPGPGTLGWLLKTVFKEEERPKDEPIGAIAVRRGR